MGATGLEVRPVTVTLPGSSLKSVAPVTDQDKTEDCPLVIEPGEAVNEEIVGRPGLVFAVVNVRSPDVDRLPDSPIDFTL